MTARFIAILTFGALAASPAFARAPLTRAQAQDRAELLFRIADVNRDGIISRAEFDAYIKATRGDPVKGGRMFDELDTAHDGQVSRAQVLGDALAKFDRADLNHDGKIDETEIAARRAAREADAAAAAAVSASAPASIVTNGAAATQ